MKVWILLELFISLNLAQYNLVQLKPLSNETTENVGINQNEEQIIKNDQLHRVPLYGDENKLMVAVNNLNNEQQKQEQANSLHDSNATCLEICNNHFGKNSKMKPEILQSCINGCSYYSLNLIQNISKGSASINAKSKCYNTCQEVYLKNNSICNLGCRLASNDQDIKTVPVETISSIDESQKSSKSSESNINSGIIETLNKVKENEEDKTKKMFRIVIPIRTISDVDQISQQNDNGLGDNSLSQIMMSIIRTMTDRARQFMDFARQQQRDGLLIHKPDNDDSSSASVQEGRFSFDPQTGESVSVHRSMSVMMTKDEDGHNKMVVMRTPPKITIHQGWNPFGLDFDRLKYNKNNDLNTHLKQSEHEEEEHIQSYRHDGIFSNIEKQLNKFGFTKEQKLNEVNTWNDDDENDSEEDDFGRKIFQPWPFLNNNDDEENRNDDMMIINENKEVSWSSCLFSMMPLLYLLAVIFLLYTSIWLFYSVPNYIFRKNRRQQPNRRETILPLRTDDEDINDKRLKIIQKLLHLTKKARYTQLSSFGGLMNGEKNNLSPTGSTLSFPPPYVEATASVNNQASKQSLVDK